MNFPIKYKKIKPISARTADDIKSRREFVEDLPKKVKNTISGIDLALINEAITAISQGTATINGESPKTRKEMYILIASYFKTAKTSLNMALDGAENVLEDYTVAIKYRNQPFIIKFPDKPGEN